MKLVRAQSAKPAHARPVASRLGWRGALVVFCAYAAVIGVTEIRLQSQVSSITSVEIAPLPLRNISVAGAL